MPWWCAVIGKIDALRRRKVGWATIGKVFGACARQPGKASHRSSRISGCSADYGVRVGTSRDHSGHGRGNVVGDGACSMLFV